MERLNIILKSLIFIVILMLGNLIYHSLNFNCCCFVTLYYNYQLMSLIIGYIVIIFILKGRKEMASPSRPTDLLKFTNDSTCFFFWLQKYSRLHLAKYRNAAYDFMRENMMFFAAIGCNFAAYNTLTT